MSTALRVLLLALSLAAAVPGQRLALWYNQPAEDWQTQALPIGNGRLGAMIFGDALHEHIQLNEISLWTGDEKNTGQYQNLADLFLDLEHGAASSYRRQLDLSTAIHSIEYKTSGVAYRREYFASFPQQVLVFHFTAGARGAYSGTLKLADAHHAPTSVAGNTLKATGQLANGLDYQTQVQVVAAGGRLTAENGALRIDKADSFTVIVAAGTNYLPDRARGWRTGPSPDRVARQLGDAAAKSFADLRAAHLADFQRFFTRVSLDLGVTAQATRALPTDERLVQYATGTPDPELEAIFFQLGRYLLISSSRPGSLPPPTCRVSGITPTTRHGAAIITRTSTSR